MIRLPGRHRDSGDGTKPEILTALGASKRFKFSSYSGAPPEMLNRLFPEIGFDPLTFTPVHAVERIISPGDEVVVAGNATLEVDPAGSSIGFRSPPTLIVFAATDEHALVLANATGLKRRWRPGRRGQ